MKSFKQYFTEKHYIPWRVRKEDGVFIVIKQTADMKMTEMGRYKTEGEALKAVDEFRKK